MFDAIAAARDSINMETYILEDDEVGQRLADALIAKQQQGVQVNLIHDAVGTLGTKKEYFKRLSDAGINVLEFNPVNPLVAKAGWDVNQRDHRKLLVVDGRSAVLGGINISSVYSSSAPGGSGSGVSGGSRGGDKNEPALARHRPAHRRPGRRAAAEALHGDVASAEGQAARAAPVLPFPAGAGHGGRARDRQHARRSVQPDLRDADLGDQQRRERDPADQRVLRPRPAADAGADRRRGARRRRQADPAEHDRLVARLPRRPRALRAAAARRRQALRAARGAAAREDRASSTASGRRWARPTSTGAASYTTRS